MPAFEIVFELDVRPDVIFFLTDGLIPGSIPAEVQNRNRKRAGAAVINSIAFGTDAGHEPLRRIASESDGVFRFVPTGMRP